MTEKTGPRTQRTGTAYAVACAVAGALLAGCGSQAPPPPSGDPATPPPSAGADTTSASTGAGQDGGGSKGTSGDSSTGSSKDAGTPAGGDGQQGSAQGDTDPDDGIVPGIEVPVAPEEEVTSLAELLEPVGTAPLVRTPLPAAASARGRLVTGYPTVLRPTRSSEVETSSVSPSGDRLQVALVGSSTLAPAQVLTAFRSRMVARGLVEHDPPAAVAGSRSAAFRRGDSVVTITVVPRSGRTSYSVHATLRAGKG